MQVFGLAERFPKQPLGARREGRDCSEEPTHVLSGKRPGSQKEQDWEETEKRKEFMNLLNHVRKRKILGFARNKGIDIQDNLQITEVKSAPSYFGKEKSKTLLVAVRGSLAMVQSAFSC
ncbi:hypothetical protein MC885_001124 [Smutsia gigantea]|nr:hypothetical protein MC885_001124 [Smutsia gigantea]